MKRSRRSWSVALGAAVALTTACAERVASPLSDHSSHVTPQGVMDAGVDLDQSLPPSGPHAHERLAASPRSSEFVTAGIGTADSIRLWVVFPQRSSPSPVVLVVHENMGLTSWVRAVADQLAADGFIAIAPDLLTGKGVPVGPDGEPDRAAAILAIAHIDTAQVRRQLDLAARYGTTLPVARQHYGIVGFCWGGGIAFDYATYSERLDAAIIYYGESPPAHRLAGVSAPIRAFYGGNDARVNATIPRADSALRALGKTFEYTIFPGAGHGFARQQDGQNGANISAILHAWPETLTWFRRYLGA